MATVHFIQQGKGDVGKSVIASFLYQVLRHQGKDVVAFDTDPVNATLLGYKEFKVIPIDIVRQGQVDARLLTNCWKVSTGCRKVHTP